MPDFHLEPNQILAITLFAGIVLFETVLPFREYHHRLRHVGKNGIFAAFNSVILAGFGATLNVSVFLWIYENEYRFTNSVTG